MKILKFKQFNKNTLRGFIEVELPSGLIIKNLTWHKKSEGDKTSEWLGLPSREYRKDDNSVGYANVVDFATKNLYWDFVHDTLKALKAYLEEKGLEDAWSGNEQEESTPF